MNLDPRETRKGAVAKRWHGEDSRAFVKLSRSILDFYRFLSCLHVTSSFIRLGSRPRLLSTISLSAFEPSKDTIRRKLALVSETEKDKEGEQKTYQQAVFGIKTTNSFQPPLWLLACFYL